MLDKNSELLIAQFKDIANRGYVKGVGKSYGNIGLTLEHEIGKAPDSKYEPDFKDIEIKCSSRFSRYPLYLFTIAFDGPGENEISRITDKYGYHDIDFPDKKVMFRKIVNAIVEKNKYNFMFDVNRTEERLYLSIFDKDGKLIEKEAYIEFANLKKHLETKLRKIAYIKASMKKIDGVKYYRYYSMLLYKLKDFDTFLNLINENFLDISIISKISKSGEDKGRYRNKNVVFSIRKENITKLFDCYYQYNHDITY